MPSNGARTFAVAVLLGTAGLVILAPCAAPAQSAFIRGDTDTDGSRNITDPIRILGFLFLGAPERLDCLDAADVDDSGTVNVTDVIFLLDFLFLGGVSIPPPRSECGVDPTADPLGCERFSLCEEVLPAPPPAPVLEPVGSPTSSPSVTLRGTTDAGLSVVATGGGETVEGTADDGGGFELLVPLAPNRRNRLAVVARGDSGTESPPARLDIIHDSEAPELFIDLPAPGSETVLDSVTVAGRVSDTLSGFAGLTVNVDGLPAEVIVGIGTNGTFERRDVPLETGENTIVVEAADTLGNSTTRELTVRRRERDPDAAQLALVSGGGQRATVGTFLPEPLVVEVRRADGTPFTRKLVTFEVSRSDGVLARERGGEERRVLQARAGASGEARVLYRLGTDAGCGNHRVTVSSVDVEGSLTVCASADPAPPAQINVSAGDGQTAEAGAPAPEPLRVWVSDSCNGVEGVPVRFRIVDGTGFVDGEREVTRTTSRTGHAEVHWELGRNGGLQTVEADFAGNLGGPAVFTALGLARDRPATTFVGLVRDNAEAPLGGALCELVTPDGSVVGSSRSEVDGRFTIDPVLATGALHLQVDGHDVTRVGGADGEPVEEGSYPALAFDVTVVPNAENSLGAAVLLPRLRPENGRTYDGTEDVVLEVEGIEGLRVHVGAGSVTLPDGRRPSPENPVTLSLDQVHVDDVPMAMTDGAAPPFAWTLQPHGVRFDPPARIEYPNMSGLRPGAITNFLSFDHDTGRFEIVATGQVSEDGATILSDPGVGLTKAGWGCNCPPYAVTGECQSCPADGGGASGETCSACAEDVRIEFIFDLPGVSSDPTLDVLEISNFVTPRNLEPNDGHRDPDNFKVEIEDPNLDSQVDEVSLFLESLRPKKQSFSPRRTLRVRATRLGRTNRFRTPWLRLVVDGVDNGDPNGGAEAVSDQTLLVSTDPQNPTVSILGQIVRAFYAGCEASIPVGDRESILEFDVDVHILEGIPGEGATAVTKDTVRQRMEVALPRFYAQANIRPGQVAYNTRGDEKDSCRQGSSTISFPQNLVAISQETGSPAEGGGTIRLGIVSTCPNKETVRWELAFATTSGATPFETALAIATRLNELPPLPPASLSAVLDAEAFENIENRETLQHSADVLVRDGRGGRVVVEASSTDPGHPVTTPEDIGGGDLVIGRASLGGSVEERALARNYGSSLFKIDLFVVGKLYERDGNGRLVLAGISGRASTLRGRLPLRQQQREPFRWSAFVSAASANGAAGNPATIAHEIGHILLDAGHLVADLDDGDGVALESHDTQLMASGSGGFQGKTTGGRRIQDGIVRFSTVGGVNAPDIPVNQVIRMRSSDLLHPAEDP